MGKVIQRGAKARQSIRNGVNEIYDTIKTTLGPAGRNALITRDYRTPRITNDGVFIAKNIELDDECEQLVAKSFVQAASETNEGAGDGTTTTMVLGGALINKCMDTIERSITPLGGSSENVVKLRKEIMAAKDLVVKEIEKNTKKVETIEQLIDIATVSVEDPELGKMVAKMVWEVGVDGYVDVIEGMNGIIETELIKGMKFSGKFAPPILTNMNRKQSEVDDCPIICTNYHLENPDEFLEVMQKLYKLGHRKVVLLANNFKPEVIMQMLQLQKNKMFVFPMKAPSLTSDEWDDVCAVVGSTLINKEKGDLFTQLTEENIGRVERIVANEKDIVITGGNAKGRAEMLKDQIKVEKLPEFKERLKRRIASLGSGIGVIRVGAKTDVEIGYLKLKLEDAQYACKAALSDGYVRGGGMCLKDIAKKLKDNVLTDVLEAPYNQIAENMGVESFDVPENIVDPAKVVRLAVENACSVASTIITTDSIIADKKDRDDYDAFIKIAEALKK